MMAIAVKVYIKPETPVAISVTEEPNRIFGGPGLQLEIGMVEITGSAEQMQLIADKINAQVKKLKRGKGVA